MIDHISEAVKRGCHLQKLPPAPRDPQRQSMTARAAGAKRGRAGGRHSPGHAKGGHGGLIAPTP
jgi:hypothetical protein